MTDTFQRFIFENTYIRGELVHLHQSYQQIIQQHHYPTPISMLLGECLLTSVLLGSTMKYRGQVTVQFQSEDAVKMIVAKCNDALQIRGLAQFDVTKIPSGNKPFMLEKGNLIVTLEFANHVKTYQSIIPLEGKSISKNIEDYFASSVQIPTEILLAVNENSAAGILLQLLPSENQSTQHQEQFREYADKLGEVITENDLLHLNNADLLALFDHEEGIRIFDEQLVEFRCQCSIDKMKNVIHTLGKNEIQELLVDKKVIDITCEYCNEIYSFDRNEIEIILGN